MILFENTPIFMQQMAAATWAMQSIAKPRMKNSIILLDEQKS